MGGFAMALDGLITGRPPTFSQPRNSKGGSKNDRAKSMACGPLLTKFRKSVHCVRIVSPISCTSQSGQDAPMELLGLAEIAALCRVTKQVVTNWRTRKSA